MKKIVLFCSAGMSTSLLVTKMREAAEKKGDEADIDAYSISELNEKIKDADIVLIGPQIRYEEGNVKKAVDGRIPVDVIDMKDYGTMNGDAVYSQAVKLMDEHQ